MRHLLSRENDEVLAQLAGARVLLAFDFDGTLAPIVEEPDSAHMRYDTAALFVKLCTLYPCAVISGRAEPDVSRRLGGASVKYVVGNHGLEPGADLEEYEADMKRAHHILEGTLAGRTGIDIEDKRYSLAIHYRRARLKRAAREAIRNAVAALPVAMRIVPGKLVVNIVPERAPNKGDALLSLRRVEQADTAFYIGDDTTDEDVFELDQPGRLLGVRVGESLHSAASYYLRNQREVDRLLSKLISLRDKQVP